MKISNSTTRGLSVTHGSFRPSQAPKRGMARPGRGSLLLTLVSMLGSTLGVMGLTPAPASAAPILTEDFTSGTFDGWTGTTRLAIDAANGSPAAPSAAATVANQSAYRWRALGASFSQVCASVNVWLPATAPAGFTGFDVFRLRTAGNGGVIKVYVASNGRLAMRNDSAGNTRSTTTQLGAGWHNVELCGSVGSATSWTLYRDGVQVGTPWQTSTGTTGVGRIQIGDTARKTFTANFDHVVVDQARGDEGAIDTTPPTVPGTPAASSPSLGTIALTWAPSTDASTPITYRIYRDGGTAAIGTTTNTTYADGGLPVGSTHTYRVDAVDPAGNVSTMSPASAPFTVPAAPDSTPPTTPGRPTGTPAVTAIALTWNASTDASAITYRIYRDGGGAPAGSSATNSYTDTALAPLSTHTYTVDAVDATGNVSARSTASLPITTLAGADPQPVPGHTRLAPETPRTDHPRITSGEITDLASIGNRVFVAGTFTSIRNNAGSNTTSYTQPYLAAYNIDTGLVDTNFRPTFGGGGVTEVEASPDGTRLFVVGRFDTVNGVTKRRVASLNPTTGAVNTGFTATTNSAATSVEASNTTVYIGGQFATVNGVSRVGLAAVDATTGQLVTGFQNNLSEGIGVNGDMSVQALSLTHDGTKLLVVHTARKVAGQDRLAAALIDTRTNLLLPWRTRLWDENLQFVGGVTRVYAGDIAPNDQYFVITSGSGGDRPPISDTAVAYPIDGGDDVQPLWVSRLFDSVYSVAITEQAVYLGGHFNYMESPTAPDPWPGLTDQGYGRGQGLAGYGLGDDIVIRDHVGAVDPAKGKALEWHPGSNSFEGNKAMLATPRGVVTGGDATTQGGSGIGRIAFYDFNSIPAPGPNETGITNPIQGRVEEADVPFVMDGTATATSGVQRVQIELRDRDTGQYLQDNLTTWGSWNAINAVLASPGATSTPWTLSLTIGGNRRLVVYARTVGNNGSQDATKAEKKFETFGLADETPTTSVSGPSGSIIPTTTFTVTGTASDDFGVNSITFTFRDGQNRYLQDDGTMSSAFNTFRGQPDVVGATSATWRYEVAVPYEGEWTAQATAVDTAGQSDLRSANRTWIVSDTATPPTVTITEPAAMIPPTTVPTLTMAPGSPVTFRGTATDDENLNFVTITLRNTATGEALTAGGTWGVGLTAGDHRISGSNSLSGTSYNWSYTTPFDLSPGSYSFTVDATDDLGLSTSSSTRGRLTIDAQVPGDAFPNGTITPSGTQNGVQVLALDLAGSATDDLGVAEVRVTIRERDSGRYLQANGTLSSTLTHRNATLSDPGGVTTNWTLPVTLPSEGDYDITVRAIDTAGQPDPSTTGATARYPIYPGDDPPVVNEDLLSPNEGTVFTGGRIVVTGRLTDDIQIAEAHVAIRNGLGQYMTSTGAFTSTSISWRTDTYLNSPGSPGSNFSYTSPLIPPGAYTVLVRGEDHRGFTTPVPVQRNVTVTSDVTNQPPVASFTASCVANVCTFDGRGSTDEEAATLTYSWNFGNGSGSGPVPTRTYTSAATYTVTLAVRDANGLSGVTTRQVTITEPAGNVAPVPVLNPPVCVARTCNFSAVGTTDPNAGDSISYLWIFGDGGATSTSTSPSRAYAADGTYTVTVVATDGWGRSASVIRTVTITEPPSNQAPTPVIGTPACAARTCTLFGTASTDPNGDAMTYVWNWGDNTATGTGSSATHTYTADGTYTVTLTVTDAWGKAAITTRQVTITEPPLNQAPAPVINAPSCTGRTCSFSSAGTSDPNGDTFTYLWNWGDATATSTASAPSHTFPTLGAFTVTLTVTDAWGDAASTTRLVQLAAPLTNAPPVPAIDAPVCAGRSCTFSAVTSSDPNGDTFTYLWNWGDGTATSTASTATHAFAVDGTYVVTLTLTDVWGATAGTTRSVTITKPPTNLPPVPVITGPVCAARACTFFGVSSSDPNSDPFTYLWNFGDGSTSTAVSPARTYATDGTYTVTLTVTDAWGDAATATRTVTIAKPATNVAPTPVIGTPICNGRACTFSAAGSSDPNGDSFTASWAWGDGTANSTGTSPAHTFPTAGTFTVTLTVTDGWGDAAWITRQVTVG